MGTPLIELETQDFVAAARRLELWAADPLSLALNRLCGTLVDCSAMAGDDPGGAAWAQAYDSARAAALTAAENAVNAVHKLAAMLAQTARNYGAADAASTAGVRRRDDEALATLAPARAYWLPTCVPSAFGGSGGEPGGWGLIAHAVGRVWPNGHQDRLRRAASSWRTSAAAHDDAAGQVIDACGPAVADRLPEADDMWRVCDGLAAQLREVSAVHASLGAACEQLAAHVDEMHAGVIAELQSVVEWTAGIEAASGLLSVVTLGVSEAAGQAGEAARVSAAAARVAAMIERFTASARTLAESVATLGERADRVAGTMAGLLDVRLSTAVVEHVRTLPGIGHALRLGSLARLQLTVRRDWPRISGMLQAAAREKGDYALGSASREEADVMGRAWVGDGARMSRDGKAWVSRDGLRQYRPPSYKPRLSKWQANLQARRVPHGDWPHNGHLDIKGAK